MHAPEYQKAIDRIFHDVRRADEILEGLEYFLSRRAEMGMAVRGYPPGEYASWLSKFLPGKGESACSIGTTTCRSSCSMPG